MGLPSSGRDAVIAAFCRSALPDVLPSCSLSQLGAIAQATGSLGAPLGPKTLSILTSRLISQARAETSALSRSHGSRASGQAKPEPRDADRSQAKAEMGAGTKPLSSSGL